MKRFWKEVVRPGIYFKRGRRLKITAQDCSDCRDSIEQLHAAGLKVPLTLEHPPADRPLDAEGFPLSDHDLDEKAAQLKRTVGRSVAGVQTRMNQWGGVEVAVEVNDPEIVKAMDDQRIEFVSPELRPVWQDGMGRTYTKVPTHFALTHRPIQVDQQPGFVALSDEVVSLSDYSGPVVLSLADLDAEAGDDALTKTAKKPATSKRNPPTPTASPRRLLKGHVQAFLDQLSGDDDPPTAKDNDGLPTGGDDEGGSGGDDNADMPRGSKDRKKLDALLAHLREDSYVLPADTDETNLVDRLLTAVMTKNAATADAQADNRSDDDNGSAQELNPMSISQYSAGGKVSPAEARKRLLSRIRAAKNLPAEQRDELLIRLGTVQFSDDGREKIPDGAISISDVVGMFESAATQFSDDSPQAALAKRIKAARDRGQLVPGVADQMLAKVGTLQFSDDGEEEGGVLSSVLDSVEKSGNLVGAFLGGDKTAGYQFSANGTEAQHPRGEAFFTGDAVIKAGDPRAAQIARESLKRNGEVPKGDTSRRAALNATNV